MEKRDLLKMTVPKLKEEALKYPDRIKGVHGMKKEQLIASLMEVLGIPDVREVVKTVRERKGKRPVRPRSEIKQKMRLLKVERAKAQTEGDRRASELLRQRVKSLRRLLRKAS